MWVETVIQYLVLDKTYAERPDFEGAKYVMSPPLRDKAQPPRAVERPPLAAYQHRRDRPRAVRFHGQKEMGRDDFTKIPNGIPSLEDRVNLLYTYGVANGRLDLAHVRRRRQHAGRQPVRPLSPQRHDPPGSDADLVVYDPDYRGKISAEDAAHERRLQRLRRLGH